MSSPRVVGIIQARMRSTRLPGKVLMDLQGEPMLVRVVERTRRAKCLDLVVVATSWEEADRPIVKLCQDRGYPVFEGHPLDVLDRYYQAAVAFQADLVVRITADCPLIDPGLIDDTVAFFRQADPPLDFAANRLPWKRSFPIGLDVEAATFSALEIAWQEAEKLEDREHVMPYLYTDPDRFRAGLYSSEQDFGSFRWTVDTEEDLVLARAIYQHFSGDDRFTWKDVLALIQAQPELQTINTEVEHRSHRDLDERYAERGTDRP